MLEKFINLNLLKSPVNWVIVFLMVALATSLIVLLIPASPNEDN